MNIKKTLALLSCLSLIHCGSDDSDSAPTEATMPGTINVGCGTSGTANCYESGVTALASDSTVQNPFTLANDQGQLETMLMFSWMIVGFPATKATYYQTYISTDMQKAIIPQAGMVNTIDSIRKDIVAKAKTTFTGSCSAAPTSGAFTTDNAVTAAWTTPTMTVPPDHPKGGTTYSKAMTGTWTKTISGTKYTFSTRVEFVCDYNAMAFTMGVTPDGSTTEGLRIAFFYDRENSSKLYTDLYLYDAGTVVSDDAMWLSFQMRGSDANNFKAWVNRVGPSGAANALGYRYAISADYSVPKISFYTIEAGTGTGDSLTEAAFLADSRVTSSSVSNGGIPSQGDGNQPKAGCSDSWMKKGQDITSASTCTGLDLSEGPAPFWSSTGKNSMYEMYVTGKDKIKAIGK